MSIKVRRQVQNIATVSGKIGDIVQVKCGNCGRSISECTCQSKK
ncbi:hypothetical protein [Nocardiopsis tropica]|uniref:Uncharacterized protein n=1 Tax=Nocardiopsis tropica TaxID=109330 RepID=A0ABV2A5A3_9ACTN